MKIRTCHGSISVVINISCRTVSWSSHIRGFMSCWVVFSSYFRNNATRSSTKRADSAFRIRRLEPKVPETWDPSVQQEKKDKTHARKSMTSTSASKSTTILVASTSSVSSGVVTAFSGVVVGVLVFSSYSSNLLECATATVTATTAIKLVSLILYVSPNVGTEDLLLFLTCKLTSNISDIHSIYGNRASTASATSSLSSSYLWSSSITTATITSSATSLTTSIVTAASFTILYLLPPSAPRPLTSCLGLRPPTC